MFKWTNINPRDPVVSARQINALGRAVEALLGSSAPDAVRGSSGLSSRISPSPKYKKYYKIISNDTGGEYTVREQRIASAFKDLETDNDRTAYDWKFRDGGKAAEIYPGWKTVTFEGEEVIVIDILQNELFPVKVTQTFGSAGNKTTQCSFTYTVKTINDVQLATVQSPAKKRPSVGKMAAPAADSYGLAFYDTSGTLVLYDANETLAPSAC